MDSWMEQIQELLPVKSQPQRLRLLRFSNRCQFAGRQFFLGPPFFSGGGGAAAAVVVEAAAPSLKA